MFIIKKNSKIWKKYFVQNNFKNTLILFKPKLHESYQTLRVETTLGHSLWHPVVLSAIIRGDEK